MLTLFIKELCKGGSCTFGPVLSKYYAIGNRGLGFFFLVLICTAPVTDQVLSFYCEGNTSLVSSVLEVSGYSRNTGSVLPVYT